MILLARPYTEDAYALNNEYLVQEPTKGTPAFVLEHSDLYTFHGINSYDGIYYVWDGAGTNSEGDTFFNPKDAVLSGNDIYPKFCPPSPWIALGRTSMPACTALATR